MSTSGFVNISIGTFLLFTIFHQHLDSNHIIVEPCLFIKKNPGFEKTDLFTWSAI